MRIGYMKAVGGLAAGAILSGCASRIATTNGGLPDNFALEVVVANPSQALVLPPTSHVVVFPDGQMRADVGPRALPPRFPEPVRRLSPAQSAEVWRLVERLPDPAPEQESPLDVNAAQGPVVVAWWRAGNHETSIRLEGDDALTGPGAELARRLAELAWVEPIHAPEPEPAQVGGG